VQKGGRIVMKVWFLASLLILVSFSMSVGAFGLSRYAQSIFRGNVRTGSRYMHRALSSPLFMSTKVQESTAKSDGSASANNNNNNNDKPAEMLFDLPTNEDNPNLLRIRHTTSHVMAMAVQRIHKDAQITIGPWIDNGFYYDFFFPDEQLNEQSLKKIKKEMDKIIREDLPMIREEISREEAKKRIEAQNEPYKMEILNSIKTEPITVYHVGDEWWDLCAGPHLESTGKLDKNAIELQSVNGAYWRGDEKNAMLQRIYGTAWETRDQLKSHKQRIQEAKRRDHRTIGKKLNLFSVQEDAGGGLVFWHPKGSIIRRLIEDFWKDAHLEDGYELLYTPHMANLDLWKTSGHFDFYKEDMFKTMEVENAEYQIKPMNCPFHCLVFKDGQKSYRDLPVRWAELGTVYRYERSGTLHGLFRVRGFTQDDAHIFCLPTQLEDEIVQVLDLTEKILNKFGFNKFDVMLSTRPDESVGTDNIWDKATEALRGALVRKGWDYGIDEGGGAFYGPKIDLKIQDAIGRKWQCSTIQCDFNLPERFDLEYTSDGGEKLRPIMVHRAIFGSLERFFGVLIESSAGDFPLWMAPTQLRLVPVIDSVRDYCHGVKKMAEALGIRCEVDNSGNRLAKSIRNAEQEKVPVVAIIGEKEEKDKTLSLRLRKGGELDPLDREFVMKMLAEAIVNNVELNEVEGMPQKKVVDVVEE
jgi:threonyl-tRNA synthetase